MTIDKKRDKLRKLIESTGGTFFTVRLYTKRGWDAGKYEMRTLNCRIQVKKHLKGGSNNNAGKSHLYTAFDMQGGYKSIWLDGVVSITYKGKTIEFKDFPEPPIFRGAML
jgi:hypothetical protein